MPHYLKHCQNRKQKVRRNCTLLWNIVRAISQVNEYIFCETKGVFVAQLSKLSPRHSYKPGLGNGGRITWSLKLRIYYTDCSTSWKHTLSNIGKHHSMEPLSRLQTSCNYSTSPPSKLTIRGHPCKYGRQFVVIIDQHHQHSCNYTTQNGNKRSNLKRYQKHGNYCCHSATTAPIKPYGVILCQVTCALQPSSLLWLPTLARVSIVMQWSM